MSTRRISDRDIHRAANALYYGRAVADPMLYAAAAILLSDYEPAEPSPFYSCGRDRFACFVPARPIRAPRSAPLTLVNVGL